MYVIILRIFLFNDCGLGALVEKSLRTLKSRCFFDVYIFVVFLDEMFGTVFEEVFEMFVKPYGETNLRVIL